MDKKDLFIVGTLGMGGFGRVELVSVLLCVCGCRGVFSYDLLTFVQYLHLYSMYVYVRM